MSDKVKELKEKMVQLTLTIDNLEREVELAKNTISKLKSSIDIRRSKKNGKTAPNI